MLSLVLGPEVVHQHLRQRAHPRGGGYIVADAARHGEPLAARRSRARFTHTPRPRMATTYHTTRHDKVLAAIPSILMRSLKP